ncbi:Uncharacterised protein [Bordetella pertussis]|nr:Uncharacterised protein [Bordetella pertussis]
MSDCSAVRSPPYHGAAMVPAFFPLPARNQ